MSIEKPFIDLAITLNESSASEIVVPSGEDIDTEIVFINNTNSIVRDIEVTLLLTGDALDKNSVYTDRGFYKSSNNTVIYNKQTFDTLEEVQPMERISLDLNFGARDLASGQVSIGNPQINISTEVSGRRVSEDSGEENIKETSLRKIMVASDALIVPVTLYETGAFANTGPIPPKVEEETTYTILWSVSNNSNDLKDARLTAILPNYITWNKKVSPSSAKVSYDENSRQVTWDVGSVAAGIGFTGDPKEVQFQITLLPSLSQLGDTPVLVKSANFSATDIFTNTMISVPVANVTTFLLTQDDSFNSHDVVVQ